MWFVFTSGLVVVVLSAISNSSPMTCMHVYVLGPMSIPSLQCHTLLCIITTHCSFLLRALQITSKYMLRMTVYNIHWSIKPNGFLFSLCQLALSNRSR